jgi:hypothetical protein
MAHVPCRKSENNGGMQFLEVAYQRMSATGINEYQSMHHIDRACYSGHSGAHSRSYNAARSGP